MTNTLTFGALPASAVDLVWGLVEPMLAPAIATADGKTDVRHVKRQLDSGELLLWVVADGLAPVAALTTRIIVYPERRGMAMDWIGGARMREWLPMAQSMLMRYAADNGCAHLEGYGRKGWDRWLRRFGWRPEYIAYRMDLDHG